MAKPSQTDIEHMIQYARPTNRDLVRRDINQAINSHVCNLLLKVAPFFYGNGTSRDLLCLHGTVVCEYQGNRYNIPIEVWLQEDHPKVPPLVYVKPTSNMRVATNSRDVQPDGAVIIPYLRNWRHPQSDLYTLLSAMSTAFGLSPPVYSASNRNTHPTNSTSNTSGYPGYPGYSTYPSGYPTYTTPYQTNPTPYSTPYPTASSMPMPSVGNPPYPYSHSYSQPTDTQEAYRDSMQTAVLDKIRCQLNDALQIGNAEIESLEKTEQDLKKGERTIESLISNAQQEQVQAQNNIVQLRSKIDEISEATKTKPVSDTTNTVKEDALVIPAPVYKQLLQAYAEEHAIQDLLYFLADGLRKESIGLDTYLKHVRELSRKQFMLRATMYRCRQVAGLQIK